MPPSTAHKRSVSSRESDTAPQSKRTRFQEPPPPSAAEKQRRAQAADDAAFDEQVEADLEQPSLANRKKAVKTDGYDSDSSDDGEGVVLSRRSGANDAADDDDDMFAPSTSAGPGDPNKSSSSSKKKEEKYLNLGDIEGQEFTGDPNDAGDEEIDSDASSDFEDEDARERKAKEGMGFEMSSFNMKSEMEEGKFAEDGTFHRSFDPHAVHDKWLDAIDDREMRRARKTKKLMAAKERDRVRAEEDAEGSKDELCKELVGYLAKGETVLEALQRLGKTSKAKSSGSSAKRKGKGEAANAVPSISSQMDVDNALSSSPSKSRPAPPPQTPIERVTSLASTLMSLGNIDIYDETYESLLRAVHRSGIVPRDWVPPPAVPADARYEYRWSPAYVAESGASATEIYGPFSKDELTGWRDANYFGDSGERVKLRMVGGGDQWGGWDVIL